QCSASCLLRSRRPPPTPSGTPAAGPSTRTAGLAESVSAPATWSVSVQVQPVGAQCGSRERRRLQRLLDSPGLQELHLRQRSRHARRGEELLHLQHRRPLPVG
ncbi:hypothetical protein BHE74_00020683, partial [Ensete ventricosum]